MLNTSEYSHEHPLKVNRYLLRHLREVTAQLTQEKLADAIGVDPKTVADFHRASLFSGFSGT